MQSAAVSMSASVWSRLKLNAHGAVERVAFDAHGAQDVRGIDGAGTTRGAGAGAGADGELLRELVDQCVAGDAFDGQAEDIGGGAGGVAVNLDWQ